MGSNADKSIFSNSALRYFASAASVCNDLKQINFFRAFSIFESGGITKHLMTGPSGNGEFCFPSTSMNIVGLGSLFPLWPVIKCLMKFDYGFL